MNNPVFSAQHIIVWEGLDHPTMECLTLQQQDDGYIITSHITGVVGSSPIAIHFLIETDLQWMTEHVLVSDLNQPDRVIELYADKNGKWFNRDEAVDELEGCLDIDISLTPFTNTLPIRRLSWQEKATASIAVVYISLPEFSLEKATQYYTRLAPGSFRFETGSRNFTADLSVDPDGFVMDYPFLFKRIFPA